MQDAPPQPLPVNPPLGPPKPLMQQPSQDQVMQHATVHGLIDQGNQPDIGPGQGNADMNSQMMAMGTKLGGESRSLYLNLFAKTSEEPAQDLLSGNTHMRGWQWKALQKSEEEGQNQWMPRVFSSEATPLTEMLASPVRQGLLHGGLGAAAGGALGSLAGPAGTAVGAGIGGVAGGLYGFGHRREENDRVIDALRRLPPGAVNRDYAHLKKQDAQEEEKYGLDKLAHAPIMRGPAPMPHPAEPVIPPHIAAHGGVMPLPGPAQNPVPAAPQPQAPWPAEPPANGNDFRALYNQLQPAPAPAPVPAPMPKASSLDKFAMNDCYANACEPDPSNEYNCTCNGQCNACRRGHEHRSKSAAQDEGPGTSLRRSAVGESKGLSIAFDEERDTTGRKAWDTIKKYSRVAPTLSRQPDPSKGQHQGVAKTAANTFSLFQRGGQGKATLEGHKIVDKFAKEIVTWQKKNKHLGAGDTSARDAMLDHVRERVWARLMPGEKSASTALVRRMLQGVLSPQTISRAAEAMPAGAARFVRNLGHGNMNVADHMVGNLGEGMAGQFVRKLPLRQLPAEYAAQGENALSKWYQPLVDHSQAFQQAHGNNVISPYVKATDQGAFQAMDHAGSGGISRGLFDEHGQHAVGMMAEQRAANGLAPATSSNARRVHRTAGAEPFKPMGLGDIHEGQFGPGGRLVDWSTAQHGSGAASNLNVDSPIVNMGGINTRMPGNTLSAQELNPVRRSWLNPAADRAENFERALPPNTEMDLGNLSSFLNGHRSSPTPTPAWMGSSPQALAEFGSHQSPVPTGMPPGMGSFGSSPQALSGGSHLSGMPAAAAPQLHAGNPGGMRPWLRNLGIGAGVAGGVGLGVSKAGSAGDDVLDMLETVKSAGLAPAAEAFFLKLVAHRTADLGGAVKRACELAPEVAEELTAGLQKIAGVMTKDAGNPLPMGAKIMEGLGNVGPAIGRFFGRAAPAAAHAAPAAANMAEHAAPAAGNAAHAADPWIRRTFFGGAGVAPQVVNDATHAATQAAPQAFRWGRNVAMPAVGAASGAYDAQMRGAGTWETLGEAGVGAAAFHPGTYRAMGRSPAFRTLGAPLVYGTAGRLAGRDMGGLADFAGGLAGLHRNMGYDEHGAPIEGDLGIGDTMANIGTAIGGARGLGQSMQGAARWGGAPGRTTHFGSAGELMNPNWRNTLDAAGQGLSTFGRNAQHAMTNPMQGFQRAMGGDWGARAALGATGIFGMPRIWRGIGDTVANHAMPAIAGQTGPLLNAGMDMVQDRMQHMGVLDQQGQFNAGNNFMHQIGQNLQPMMGAAGQGMDHIFHSMGMDPTRMSTAQKIALLGGSLAGGAGMAAGSPLMAAGGGASVLAGLLPMLMRGNNGPSPNAAQPGQFPGMMPPAQQPGQLGQRDEWQTQRRLNGAA